MKLTNNRYYSIAEVVVIILCLSITSCLPVPYYVSPDVVVNEQVELAGHIILTVGPRKLLEEMAHKITKSYTNIEVVDGLVFRDSAFPNGGWKLGQILDPVARERVIAQLDVRYLVIVGPDELLRSESEGFFFPLLAGAMSEEKVSTISAAIIDMTTGEVVCQVNSEAHGTERTVAYVVIVAGTIPLTSASAIDGLAKATGQKIDELVGSDNTRIAILATEISFHESMEKQNTLMEMQERAKEMQEGASQGDPVEQYNVFSFMSDGYIEPVAAWEWLCKAADQGYKKAQVEVGYWHNVTNWEHAQPGRIEWLRKAGIQADNRVAYMWYTIAAEGDSDRLRTINDLFSGKLTEEEITEADDMVRNWKPGQCPTPY